VVTLTPQYTRASHTDTQPRAYAKLLQQSAKNLYFLLKVVSSTSYH